jgi:hypothetical protein
LSSRHEQQIIFHHQGIDSDPKVAIVVPYHKKYRFISKTYNIMSDGYMYQAANMAESELVMGDFRRKQGHRQVSQ